MEFTRVERRRLDQVILTFLPLFFHMYRLLQFLTSCYTHRSQRLHILKGFPAEIFIREIVCYVIFLSLVFKNKQKTFQATPSNTNLRSQIYLRNPSHSVVLLKVFFHSAICHEVREIFHGNTVLSWLTHLQNTHTPTSYNDLWISFLFSFKQNCRR